MPHTTRPGVRHPVATPIPWQVGEELAAELSAARDRLEAMQGRATAAAQRAAEMRSDVAAAVSAVQQAERAQAELDAKQRAHQETLHEQCSVAGELAKAVRALVLDAELRCSLDEREVEFLWAAPSQVYGQHGWRKNNGSLAERTPYPAGNFKLAVRHGSESNARDVLQRRRRLLGSIALGKQGVDAAEAEASTLGAACGPPVRLPQMDEMRRRWPATTSGPLLEPARAVLSADGDLREFAPIPPPGHPRA